MTKESEGVTGARGLHKTSQEKSGKPAGTSDEDQEKMDLKATSTIQLCLADEVMYNKMDEEMVKKL